MGNHRCTGKTTRVINDAVERLFQFKEIFIPNKNHLKNNINFFNRITDTTIIIDEDWNEGIAQEEMFYRLLDRLKIEHSEQFNVNKNEKGYTIKLKIK